VTPDAVRGITAGYVDLSNMIKGDRTVNLSSCDEWRPGVLCYVRDRV